MYKTAPGFLIMTACCAILAGLAIVVAAQFVFAQHGSAGAFINSSASLSSLARRQYLSGKKEESIALYQKAIEKAEQDYGKNSPAVGELNYEMGVRAYDLCRFDLAERCLKKAVGINSNSLSAQLMLGQLLRFRNRDSEAYREAERAVKKHWDASEARKEFMLCMQNVDPAGASQQAFVINCLENGTMGRIPPHETQQTPNKSQIPPPASGNNNESKKSTSEKSTSEKKEASKQIGKSSNKSATKNNNANKPTKTSSGKKNRSSKTHKSEHMSPLLVPPPPMPNWFGLMNPKHNEPDQPTEQTGLKAKAASIKKSKAAKSSSPDEINVEDKKGDGEQTPKHTTKHPAAESDSDFLLDWASIKKKNGQPSR